MDEMTQRLIAQNEVRFREHNEQRIETHEAFHGVAGEGRLSIVCECAIGDCEAMVELTTEEYRSVRVDDRRFVVLPEHVVDATEDVVERHDGWWVVEKTGVGAAIAEDEA